jgi:hypothetical protein
MLLLCPVLVLLATGCGETDAGYFPLDDGWRWGYRITIGTKGAGDETYRSFVSNLPRQTLGEEEAVPRLAHDGRVHYYTARPDGIRHLASRGEGDDLVWQLPDQFVLRTPPKVGSSWRIASHTYLLKKRGLFDELAPLEATVDMEYTVEKVDDVVMTPAGSFEGCARVRAVGSTSYALGPEIGMVPISVEVVEWFAPGVGLVRMERWESSHPENPGNVWMVQELEVFDKGSWFD